MEVVDGELLPGVAPKPSLLCACFGGVGVQWAALGFSWHLIDSAQLLGLQFVQWPPPWEGVRFEVVMGGFRV